MGMASDKEEAYKTLKGFEHTSNTRIVAAAVATNMDGSTYKPIRKLIKMGWFVDEISHRSEYNRVYFLPLSALPEE